MRHHQHFKTSDWHARSSMSESYGVESEPLSTSGSLAVIREYEAQFELEGVSFSFDDGEVTTAPNTQKDGGVNKTRVPFGSSSGSSGSVGSNNSSNSSSNNSAASFESGSSHGSESDNDEDVSFFFGGGDYSQDPKTTRTRRKRLDLEMKKDKKRYRSKLNIVVLHLDLGIGGAERLMVNVAISLMSLGHNVKIVTSHHDSSHCFEETLPRGIIGNKVDVYGDWLPRQIFGKFTAMCSVVRMVYIAVVVLARHMLASFLQLFSGLKPSPRNQAGKSKWVQYQQHSKYLDAFPSHVDLIVMDGVSLPLPLFSWMGIPSIFYCHFPDKLLALGNSDHDSGLNADLTSVKGSNSTSTPTGKPVPAPPTSLGARLRLQYREVLDRLEELTTGCAEVVMVNSQYTASVFKEAFTVLGRDVDPLVVYPTLDPPTLALPGMPVAEVDGQSKPAGEEDSAATVLSYLKSDRPRRLLVSLNRYERKKRVDLAVEAFAELRRRPDSGADEAVLVIAGGYDGAVRENAEVLQELKDIAARSGLREGVDLVFRTSISSLERFHLLSNASALLYTPTNEHFGIVPLEAMKVGCPVIAVATGGPRETVLHGVTGYLVKQSPMEFASAMASVLEREDGGSTPTNLSVSASAPSVSAGKEDAVPVSVTCKYLMRSQRSSMMGAAGVAHVNSNFHHRIMRQQFDMCLQVLVPDLISPLTSNLHVDNNGVTRYIGTTGARIRTSSNDDAATNFVPFDDGVTELTSESPSPAQSRDGSPRQSTDRNTPGSPVISLASENGLPLPSSRQISGDGPADASKTGGSEGQAVTTFAPVPAKPATMKKNMNLVIPPYRHMNRKNSSAPLHPEISPYNPAAIATSLKTGVNDRYKLYASHCAAVVRNWMISITIVVAVPVLVALCADV